MRAVTCSLGVSLDGYVVGPDGRFDWSTPDAELFSAATDEVRGLGVHLLGRRLYETMSYWETADQDPALGEAEREFAALWTSLPKVVFSRTLTDVQGSYRLAAGSLAEEVARWRAEPGDGDIALGGPTLLAEAAALDLVDEYRLRVHPVLVGGGTPFFPRAGQRADLELIASRRFDSGRGCGVGAQGVPDPRADDGPGPLEPGQARRRGRGQVCRTFAIGRPLASSSTSLSR